MPDEISGFRRTTVEDMLVEAAAYVPSVGPREARRMMREMPELVLVDVRDPDEFEGGHVPGSLNISRGGLEFYIEEAVPDTAQPLLLVSRASARALLAARTLQSLGYTAVWVLEGGLEVWKDWGYPIEHGA